MLFTFAMIVGLAVGGLLGFVGGFIAGASERGIVTPGRNVDEGEDAWGDGK